MEVLPIVKKCDNKRTLITWDFTLPADSISVDDLIVLLVKFCNQWAFQKEKGHDTGYIHYQARMKLKSKACLTTIKNKFNLVQMHLSPTSKMNTKNNFYVMKEDTRIDGPWTSDNYEIPQDMPWDIALIKELYPFQKSIIDLSKEKTIRKVNIVINEKGDLGKTTIARYMQYYKLAMMLPVVNDCKDFLGMICSMKENYPCYLVDMPRCISKEKLYGLYSAIETVKGGNAYDIRYKFRSKMFDPPCIIVFTNKLPELELLSFDRWKFWTINDKKELVDYNYLKQGLLDISSATSEYFDGTSKVEVQDVCPKLNFDLNLLQTSDTSMKLK